MNYIKMPQRSQMAQTVVTGVRRTAAAKTQGNRCSVALDSLGLESWGAIAAL